MSTKEVFLEGNPPWGFRMNGGCDAGHSLRISRVNPGSKAEAKGVREGDLITSINGQSTKCLTNSESHALLRTVKENLLLGLNEEKNASPRRRSREIKTASIISHDKERPESPAQPKGKAKASANQKRHQRRTRLKHRIKEILGIKSKEKKEPRDEGWVIVEKTVNGQETRSVLELDTDEEAVTSGANNELKRNNSEGAYDSFMFKDHESQESSQTTATFNTSPPGSLKDENHFDFSDPYEKQKSEVVISEINISRRGSRSSNESHTCYESTNCSPSSSLKISKSHLIEVISDTKNKEDSPVESNDLWLLRRDVTAQKDGSAQKRETEAVICEDDRLTDSPAALPSCEMLEVCNATIMIEEDCSEIEELPVPIIVAADESTESSEPDRSMNSDYEPIEVNSSTVAYPSYSTTLSYYFPQRRYLEAITEENSDLSESNEDKQVKTEKPWENSDLIKQANNIDVIPNDWYGSDEGIDTSWRDGKSIEEVSDVAIVSDSFSDSDLMSEDLKASRGLSEDGTIKYSISASRSKEHSSNQHGSTNSVVLGKPPIRSVNFQRNDRYSHILNSNLGTQVNSPLVTKNDSKVIKADKRLSNKINEKKPDNVASKVTCKIIKENEFYESKIKSCIEKDKNNVVGENEKLKSSDGDKEGSTSSLNKPEMATASKLSCKLIEHPDSKTSPKEEVNIKDVEKSMLSDGSYQNQKKHGNSPAKSSLHESKSYIRTTPSSSVLKNVVFSYYNGSKNTKHQGFSQDCDKKIVKPDIEVSTDIIKPGSDKDIELVYIDSSDSEIFSNRTSIALEKEEVGVLDEDGDSDVTVIAKAVHTSKNLSKIKEDITTINQSVKELSDISSVAKNTADTNKRGCQTKSNKFTFETCVLPNLLSPVLNRKSPYAKQIFKKRRYSYPMTDHDLLKKSNEINCRNCCVMPVSYTQTYGGEPAVNYHKFRGCLTPVIPFRETKLKDSPIPPRKLSLRSLPNTPSPNIFRLPSSDYENQSIESMLLDYSDSSVTSESYTLPDVTQDHGFGEDVNKDTMKVYHLPPSSPKIPPRSPISPSEIVDLHRKFVERRGYHEASPVLKRKTPIERTPEPDIIALSKCQERSEHAYTPELLAEAANLLTLHGYKKEILSNQSDHLNHIETSNHYNSKLPTEGIVKTSHMKTEAIPDGPAKISVNKEIDGGNKICHSECSELLSEAASLIALQKYHESRQRKMRYATQDQLKIDDKSTCKANKNYRTFIEEKTKQIKQGCPTSEGDSKNPDVSSQINISKSTEPKEEHKSGCSELLTEAASLLALQKYHERQTESEPNIVKQLSTFDNTYTNNNDSKSSISENKPIISDPVKDADIPEMTIIDIVTELQRVYETESPELLAEAANLLAFQKYHESLQKEMKSNKKYEVKNVDIMLSATNSGSKTLTVKKESKISESELTKIPDLTPETGKKGTIVEFKKILGSDSSNLIVDSSSLSDLQKCHESHQQKMQSIKKDELNISDTAHSEISKNIQTLIVEKDIPDSELKCLPDNSSKVDGNENAIEPKKSCVPECSELLVEAARLSALQNYYESKQGRTLYNKDQLATDEITTDTANYNSHVLIVENETEVLESEAKKLLDTPSEIGMNGNIIECKQVNKSESTENETVGKSRLLELFQKLESESSTTECTLTEPGPAPDHDYTDLEVNELLQNRKISSADEKRDSNVSNSEKNSSIEQSVCDEQLTDSEVFASAFSVLEDSSEIVIKFAPGEVFQRKMYEEYLGKMAELAERRNMKIIKVSNVPNAINAPSHETQPLEAEFMNKLKERNEKLGIVIDEDESDCKTMRGQAKNEDDLPKHLKELMDITEECGDILGKDGLLVEIDEALSPERKGFLTAKGVWSPATTPEVERKKFDFSNEIKEEREREKQREEEEKKEPKPAIWTPRSAGPSPTLERKFKSVNFQSPPPSRKEETKTPAETPELPKDLPLETDKDAKSRLISNSSENSPLSPSLRLPTAQNPTITLLQKAREGQIPRGAQYLDEEPIVGPDEIIYSVKKEYVSEHQPKKIVELGPRKIEGIGPTTKEGVPIVLRSEVKEDNKQRWYKRMYDSLHKADHDKDFVTVKYKTRRGHYPYNTYSGGYSSEPERLGYDSDTSLSKYATLDRRKIRNKENDFTTSTMPRNRYGPDVKFALNTYKNQPGRIEDYTPGTSSIAETETKKWWDEVMDIFDGDLNESKTNNYNYYSKPGKPYTYSLKDAGYESDSTLVFKRRDNMSGQLLSPSEQKMAYKVIQKGGEVPFQGLRKPAPERPKEDSEIEYFPLSPTLTRIRVHKRSPKEKVYYPVTGDVRYPAVKRTARSVVPSPPRRESSRYNSTLKMFAHVGTTSPDGKTEYFREKLLTRLPKSDNIDLKIEKSHGKIKSSVVKYEPPKSHYGVIRPRKEVLRKSPELKSPAEVKKALKESKVAPGTVVKSSTTLYSPTKNRKPKEDKALKVTVAISTKGKDILSPSSMSSKSDRKSPIPSKPITKAKVESPPISRNPRPLSRLSTTSTTVSDQHKKLKKEIIIDPKRKKEKKTEVITKLVDKNKEEEKKKTKKKQENGKKKNGSKKKDKENIPQDVVTKNSEIIALLEPPKQDFFQKLLLRESNSPNPSVTSTVSRTPSILERAKKFTEPQKTCFKSEPSLNLNVYLNQKRPVSESRFRSLERKSNRALSPFYGTYEFYDKLDKFDRHNNVWDCSLNFEPSYDSIKSRSSSEPPHASPTFSQDVCDNIEQASPSTSRSPSCRRIRRPSSRAIETISGVRRKFRSKSLTESDKQSHMGSTSSLSMSQFTDHEEYKTYFCELLHQTKKSEKFKELHKFYSSLERMAELEKTTSNTDLRPRLKGEEVIDFDRWKQLRNKEKAEKELNTLYEKLKDDQKEKGFLFQPREPVRWSGDLGLRHREKSVEDLRAQYQRLVEKSLCEKKSHVDINKDVYKPLWRGNSVVNLANSLTSITGSKRGRPVRELSPSLIKPPVKKDKEIGSRLWSSLSMEQVNALKNQLSEIYSTVSNLKNERIQKMRQNIEDYEISVSDLRQESPLHVRSNSLVSADQLYSPVVKRKSSKRQECMKADSISSLPSWKSTTMSENEKKKLSLSLSAEIKERIKRKKHGSLVIPRETLGAVAAIKGNKKFKSSCNSEISPRTCYSLLSDESVDKSEERNKDFLLVLTPKDKTNDVKKMVDDWGTKEYARMVQTTSSSSSSASTVIHLGYKDDTKTSDMRIGDLSQSQTDLRQDFDIDKTERKTLYSSQSFTNLKDLFGEKNATTYATLPLRNIKKPCYSSNDSLYKSISPDPMKYYRAYLNVVKAGDVRKLREKFESYDDIYNLRKEQSPVRKMFQSDPDLARDFLSRKGGESRKVVVKGQEVGDVQWLRKKYECRKVSPVPFKVEDRYMPHINVISKTASLQRRSLTPPSRVEFSRTGNVERLKERFEKDGMSLLGQMYTSTPEMGELRDIAPYLECEWVAHRNPSRSPSRRKPRLRPASASPVRQSILKQTDIFANQEFNPEIHRPVCRYQPEPWPSKPWARPTVTFKEPLGNPIPTPPRDSTLRQRIQESPHRYLESEVNIHYKSPVRREAKAAWPEDELAQRQAEIMRRIYQEQKRTKYLNELHDMYSRRHADNLLPSQKSPIPLNRYDDFPVEVQPPRPRDRTPEPKLVARALYNFVGQTSRELSFRKGDIIYVRRQIDKNWYEGEHNAMIGLFPFNYVEIIPYDGIRTLPKKANEGQARARFNFQAQTHLELSLVKGELVLLTRRVDENWFEGRIGNRKGIFPVSYVEVLVEPGERPETPSGSTPSKPLVAPASHSIMLNGAKDLGQQHYQPPRPTIYSSSSLPPSSKMRDISLVNQTLHIDTQSDPVPYRVLYNYRPQNEDELELKEGDIVYVMEKCDDGWYVGSLHRNGQFGTFPGNYVERIQ